MRRVSHLAERTSNVDVGVAEIKIMRSSRLEESAWEFNCRTHQSKRCAQAGGEGTRAGNALCLTRANVERRCRSDGDENYELVAVGGIGAGVPTQQSKRRARRAGRAIRL